MRDVQRFILPIMISLAAVLLLPGSAIQAQNSDPMYFPETGFWVGGAFLETYLSAGDAETIFGNPITGEITNPDTGVVMQYFERARMDLIPTDTGSYIELADLGSFMYRPGESDDNQVVVNSANCRYFNETGRNVCYAMLNFYDLHNGAVFFGNPISELEMQDGRYVQYFEKVRMEFNRSDDQGGKVVLTDLGSIYLQSYGNDVPATGMAIAGALVQPQVHAFVEDALTAANTTQTLYIIVQDQALAPVEGAEILVVITWPDQPPSMARPAPTDVNGISSLPIAITDLSPKEVVTIEVQAVYQGQEAKTSTWFRIWW